MTPRPDYSDGPTVTTFRRTIFRRVSKTTYPASELLKPSQLLDVSVYIARGHIVQESKPYSKDIDSFSALYALGFLGSTALHISPRPPCRLGVSPCWHVAALMWLPVDGSIVGKVWISVYPVWVYKTECKVLNTERS